MCLKRSEISASFQCAEDYVSFEIAKLLKEKGFDEECIYVYRHDGEEDIWDADKEDIACQKPTLQMAMKWLREVHNIAIDTEWEHLWYAYIKPMTSNPSEEDYYQCESSKYEEACEEAIKYCCENLI